MKKTHSSRNSVRSSKSNGFSFAIIVLLLLILFFSIKTLQDKKALELSTKTKSRTSTEQDTMANLKEPPKKIPKYIVLDPGHGGFDDGACSPDESLLEKKLVLNFCKKIKSYLLEDDIRVYLTRDSDISINGARTEKQDLHNRSDLINSFEKASLLVSLHNNSNDDPNCSGIFNYITEFNNEYTDKNIQLSSCILDSIGLTTDWKVNSTNKQDIYILNHATMPSVLVECGFLSNRSDIEALSNNSKTDELCQAIAQGIKDYLDNLE